MIKGYKHKKPRSSEHCQKIAENNRRRVWSAESIQKKRDFMKGKSLFKGRKHTQETCNKLKLVRLGTKLPEITKQKIRQAIKKLGIKPPSFLNHKHSEETKNKISQTRIIKGIRLSQVFPFKDTSIEIKLQNLLKESNIPFQTHYPILGQPDIFIQPNICIFADGCYWHKCKDCILGQGKERDNYVTQELQKQGYIVIRFWEHEINKSINNCFFKIKNEIH